MASKLVEGTGFIQTERMQHWTYQVRHVLFGFSMVSWGVQVQVPTSRDWRVKTPLDSLQVSSGHSLNEMDWWFHRSPQTKRARSLQLCFGLFLCKNPMCSFLAEGWGFRSIERGLPIILSLSWDQLATFLSPLLPFFFRSTVSFTWLRNTGGFAPAPVRRNAGCLHHGETA